MEKLNTFNMYEEETYNAKLASRISARLDFLQRSAITAALNVGLERTYIRDFLIGRKKSLGSDKMDLVAKALNWTAPELTAFDSPVSQPGENEQTLPGVEALRGSNDIPVLGIAMGGDTGGDSDSEPDFWMNGEVVNYITRPRGIANARNVFSLYVGGESMFPRFRERDLVYVQSAAPAGGDDVVIEMKPTSEGAPHPSFIKEFVRRRGNLIIVRQYNPPKELTFDASNVLNIFRVIPLKELVG